LSGSRPVPDPRAALGTVARFVRGERDAASRVHDGFGPADFALSALAWGAGAAWALPTLGGLTLLAGPLGIRPERLQPLYRIYSAVQLALLGIRWRAHVDPGVDPRTPYCFFQNHVNHFDFIACHNATPHFRQGIELDAHFRYPLYGPFMRSRGTVPVLRGETGQTAALRERIRAELARGRSILGFPEGTRTRDGRVGPFKRGLFLIARELGVPIVPVAVTGMWDVMRKGSVMIRPGGTVDVHVGAPVPTAEVPDERLPALIAAVHDWIAARIDRHLADPARRRRVTSRAGSSR
jgi:1-acyl-sn-glycerol-3-phosphate acyltransferase